MSLTDEILPLLKKLRLSGVLQSLELRTRQAVDDDLSHTEFLYRLLCEEEGLLICRSPSCDLCGEFDHCFGPED